VYLLSGSPAVRRYEEDLMAEIHGGERGLFRLAVGQPPAVHADAVLDPGPPLPDPWQAICAVLAGQILGVYRSLACRLRPDSPSPSGAISRVVQGVTIHPHAPEP
jgi:tagatose-6-phosphate ketose/aldose isomerase